MLLILVLHQYKGKSNFSSGVKMLCNNENVQLTFHSEALFLIDPSHWWKRKHVAAIQQQENFMSVIIGIVFTFTDSKIELIVVNNGNPLQKCPYYFDEIHPSTSISSKLPPFYFSRFVDNLLDF